MARREKYLPVFRQLTGFVRSGFDLLDERSREQVVEFVEGRRHKNGGFIGRGKDADVYYSLFGILISEALDLTQSPEIYYSFFEEAKTKSPAEVFSFILIKKALLKDRFRRPSIFSLARILFRQRRNGNLAYSAFLFFLVYDALYQSKGILFFFVKLLLRFYKIGNENPCSLVAALAVAKHQAGLETANEVGLLMSFYQKNEGFKLFSHVSSCDLLSTAVALFALKTVGYDLRILAPGCFRFIQENYDAGAFLSGDGDPARDLEYTFYGLLALGILA